MATLRTEMSDLLTSEHLDSLNRANIWSTNDFFANDLRELSNSTNVKYHILKDLHDKIRQRYTFPIVELNFSLERSIEECKICPTGLPELTSALDGGFQTQEIVEFFGECGCGKSEMCYLLCGEILTHFNEYHILYIDTMGHFDKEKVEKYTKIKAGNRELTEDDIFKCLSRVMISKPKKLPDLVHLMNTIVHTDRHNEIKCVIIDSLSFIIQEDLLEARACKIYQGGEQLNKLKTFAGDLMTTMEGASATDECKRKRFTDIYLYELMRILKTIAIIKNVIIVVINSDQQLTKYKSWTNAIDHRIQLAKMSEFSQYHINNPKSTVCRATIIKTIHNITRIGYTIPLAIDDEGLFAIRLKSISGETNEQASTSKR